MKDASLEKNGLPVAGVDLVAATAKAVILSNNTVLASSVIPTGFSAAGAGELVAGETLKKGRSSYGVGGIHCLNGLWAQSCFFC